MSDDGPLSVLPALASDSNDIRLSAYVDAAQSAHGFAQQRRGEGHVTQLIRNFAQQTPNLKTQVIENRAQEESANNLLQKMTVH